MRNSKQSRLNDKPDRREVQFSSSLESQGKEFITAC